MNGRSMRGARCHRRRPRGLRVCSLGAAATPPCGPLCSHNNDDEKPASAPENAAPDLRTACTYRMHVPHARLPACTRPPPPAPSPGTAVQLHTRLHQCDPRHAHAPRHVNTTNTRARMHSSLRGSAQLALSVAAAAQKSSLQRSLLPSSLGSSSSVRLTYRAAAQGAVDASSRVGAQ